jgi:hypothetical protein
MQGAKRAAVSFTAIGAAAARRPRPDKMDNLLFESPLKEAKLTPGAGTHLASGTSSPAQAVCACLIQKLGKRFLTSKEGKEQVHEAYLIDIVLLLQECLD